MQNVASNRTKTKSAAKAKQKTPDWLPNAAIVTVGGMIFTSVGQWLMQIAAVAWEDGHLIDSDVKTFLFLPMILALCFAMFLKNGGFTWGSASSNARQPVSYGGDNANGATISIFVLFSAIALCFLQVEVQYAITIMCLSSLGLCGLGALYFVYDEPKARTFAVLTWVIGYLALWVLAATMSSVSIWIFIGAWVVLGALGGNSVTAILRNASMRNYHEAGHAWRSTDTVPEKLQQSRRARMTSAVVSQYGRIPQDTFDLFNQQVRRVTGAIAASIPLGASEALRNATILEVLTVTLRDWRENDNLKGLQPVDIDDLRSFVEAALFISATGSSAGSGTGSDTGSGTGSDTGTGTSTSTSTSTGITNDAISLVIYKIALRALLLDWLENWNVDGQSGPPFRR